MVQLLLVLLFIDFLLGMAIGKILIYELAGR